MRVITAVGACDEIGIAEYSPNDVTRQFTSDVLEDGVKCLSVFRDVYLAR